MGKITFIGKSFKNCVSSTPIRTFETSFHKISFNSLTRKERRFIERKMKEE